MSRWPGMMPMTVIGAPNWKQRAETAEARVKEVKRIADSIGLEALATLVAGYGFNFTAAAIRDLNAALAGEAVTDDSETGGEG